MTRLNQASEEYFETNVKTWGPTGGGENCLELYGHTRETSKRQTRRRGVIKYKRTGTPHPISSQIAH